jgi:hypothetical protein
MKKALITTSIVALATGAGVWALGGWAAVGLTFLVPLLLGTGGLLLVLGVSYGISKMIPDSFKESFAKSANDLADIVAA